MSEFKQGDYITVTKFTYEKDCDYFKIGQVYKVRHVRWDGDVYVCGIGLQLAGKQIKKLEDNPLNRLLYPELDWSKND